MSDNVIDLDNIDLKEFFKGITCEGEIDENFEPIDFSEYPQACFQPEPCGLISVTQNDKRIFKAYITNRIAINLVSNGYFRLNNSIFNVRKRKFLNKIPDNIYQEAFNCKVNVVPTDNQIEIYIEKDYKEKKKKLDFFYQNGGINGYPNQPTTKRLTKKEAIKLLSLPRKVTHKDFFLGDYSQESIFKNVLSSLPEFKYFNDTLNKINLKLHNDDVKNIFDKWLSYMKDNCDMQLRWFENMCFHYLFANTNQELPKVFVGIGINKSGKGTFIQLLQTMIWCSPVKRFNQSTAEREYTTATLFEGKETLKVCDEWLLTKQVDQQTQSLFKSATRREEIVVRDVGKEAKVIKPIGSYVLFCNTNKDNEEQALDEAYRFFSKWRAYDRFDFQWIDWTRKFPDIIELLNTINNDNLAPVFGKYLFDYMLDIKQQYDNKEFELMYQEIPSKYKLSESSLDGILEEQELLNIFHLFLNHMYSNHTKLWSIISKRDSINITSDLNIKNDMIKDFEESKRIILDEFKEEIQKLFRFYYPKLKRDMIYDFFIIEYNEQYNSDLEKVFSFKIKVSLVEKIISKDFIIPEFFEPYIKLDCLTNSFKYFDFNIIKYKMDKGLS